MPHETFSNCLFAMLLETCLALVVNKIWYNPKRQPNTISEGEEFTYSYYAVSNAYRYITSFSSQISCTGGTVNMEGGPVSNIVQYVTDQITYKKEEILVCKDTSLVAFYDNVVLDCPMEQEHCLHNHVMYVWMISDNHCPLMMNKFFNGYEVTTQYTNNRVLMSSDGSLLRFVLKGSTEICGQQMIRTNYENLMMVKTHNPDGTRKRNLMQKRVSDHPRQVRLSLYIANRDDTL